MNLKIRHLLSVLFGLMLLISLGFIIWGIFDLTATSRKADWLVQSNRLADLVIEANSIQARERGLTNILISQPETVTDETRARALELRAAGDNLYRNVLAMVREITGRDPSHPLTGSLQTLAKRRAALENARMLADRIIDNEGITMAKKSWTDTMDAFIASLVQVRRGAFNPVDEFGRAYHDNLLSKEIVFSASEHAGRERAIIGAVIARARPLSAEEIQRLRYYRVTVENKLKWLVLEMEETDRGPQLKEAMDRLNEEFLGRYQRLREAVYTASAQRAPYPVDASTWFAEATRGIDSILAVATAVGRHTKQSASAVQRQKIREIVLLIAVISVVLGAMFTTVMLVRRRIFLPLQLLTTASKRIAAGDLQQPVMVSGDDELGELARSFEQMRGSLLSDITERERVEAALRTSEERFTLVVRGAKDGIWDWNLLTGKIYFSPRWKQMLGYGEAEVVGSFAALQGLIHADDLGLALDAWVSCMEGETDSFSVDYRLKTKQGDYRWIQCRGLALCDAAGGAVRIAGSHTDISGRIRARQALEKTAADLRQKADELERSNRELDQFAYVTSHDLKAPLRAIANLSQWIEEDLDDKLTDDTRKHMDLLRGRVARMEALINGILEYSQVGRVVADVERVDVTALLDEIIESLAPPESLAIEIGPDMPTFETVRMRFSQVFANLIGNAVKYHHRDDGRVRVGVRKNGAFYEFTVADDGPGIAPQYHDRVFQIFQTLQARDTVESTGVGLTLVKKIVEEQGGSVHLESAEGQGATFRFTWPKTVVNG